MYSIPSALTNKLNQSIFKPVAGESYLVYIPEVVFDTERRTHYKKIGIHRMNLMHATEGVALQTHVCTNNVGGGDFEAAGYDYTCPLCETMPLVWELYKWEKREIEKLNLTPTDVKKQLQLALSNLPLTGVQEQFFFPILVINKRDTFKTMWEGYLELKFVTLTPKQYTDHLLAQTPMVLDAEAGFSQVPCGIWTWQFPKKDTNINTFQAAAFFKSGKDTDLILRNSLEKLAVRLLRENVEVYEDDMTYSPRLLKPQAQWLESTIRDRIAKLEGTKGGD